MMKRCGRCGSLKDLADFGISSKTDKPIDRRKQLRTYTPGRGLCCIANFQLKTYSENVGYRNSRAGAAVSRSHASLD
jgi:hypothetical protein